MTEKCGAELHIGDDFGDNHATLTCGLEPRHAGQHLERYPRGDGKTFVSVFWDGNDKRVPLDVTCARCGAKGTSDDFMLEEGDEWECQPCWERCEAAERASNQTGEEP